MTADILRCNKPFGGGGVRQPGADHITNGVDARDAGFELIIDCNSRAALGRAQRNTHTLQPEAGRKRRATRGDQHHIGRQALLRAIGSRKEHFFLAVFVLNTRHFHARLNGDALLLEALGQLFAKILVHVGNNARQELQHGHFRAQPRVDIGKLHPDHATADDHQLTRDIFRAHGLVAGPERATCQCAVGFLRLHRRVVHPDIGAVHTRNRHFAGHRARGDNNIGRRDLLHRAIGLGHFHRIFIQDLAVACNMLDFRALEQELDTFIEPRDDFIFAAHQRGKVVPDILSDQAEVFSVLERVQCRDGADHGFRRDTAPVQTRPARIVRLNTDHPRP